MPSFAKPAQPNMADVFKSHPRPQVIEDMITKYRLAARTHLQNTIPNKLTRIQSLLDSESDPTSVLWTGHTETEAYHPKMLQPTDPLASRYMANHTLVLPGDIVQGTGEAESLPNGGDSGKALNGNAGGDDASTASALEKGAGEASTGAHWFEVFPPNTVQNDLIELSVKEHADLHMICQDLKIWLEMEIPLIEDGNSFGADVQAHIIRELSEASKRSNAFQNGCRAHYTDRLKLAQEWAKYPNMPDFERAISASDKFDHFLLRSYLRSLLVIYAGLMVRFERNWGKVINPKGSGGTGGGMY